MELHSFLQILRKYIGTDKKSIQEYLQHIFSLIIQPPDDADDITEDKYYPFSKTSQKTAAYRLFTGERLIPQEVALIAHGHFDKTKFVDEIYQLPEDTKLALCEEVKSNGITCDTSNVDEVLAEIFHSFIKVAANKKSEINIDPADGRALDGSIIPAVPINPVRYSNGIVHIGTEQIKLPVQLVPLDQIDEEELPYINALCEVYAEKLTQAITLDNFEEMPSRFRQHLSDQRKSYYSAESVHRSVREVFSDGEEQFKALKDDAYEGIQMVYFDDRHNLGYDRLQAVLDKITSTTLNKSTLINIVGMISNLEKKGICHILVNDDVIKSWVDIDG